MKIILILSPKDGLYRAYFEGTPDFYGEGVTQVEAIRNLSEKMYAVLEAYARIIGT